MRVKVIVRTRESAKYSKKRNTKDIIYPFVSSVAFLFQRRYDSISVKSVGRFDKHGRADGDQRRKSIGGGVRIGKGENNQGDGYHYGDIGGGQYLNACVWFEILTGKSCIGNPYRPLYMDDPELSPSEELVLMLQKAAHEAVAKL